MSAEGCPRLRRCVRPCVRTRVRVRVRERVQARLCVCVCVCVFAAVLAREDEQLLHSRACQRALVQAHLPGRLRGRALACVNARMGMCGTWHVCGCPCELARLCMYVCVRVCAGACMCTCARARACEKGGSCGSDVADAFGISRL
eukprot:3346710-Pleurochrysis_carterae.AAC.1